MIETLTQFPNNVIAVACSGNVTRRDYETILIPRVTKALEDQKKVRLYYQIGVDFEGIDPGAMWEDLKIGIEHLSRWERIAVVTDVYWIKHTIKAFGFLIPGAVRVFPLAEAGQARGWIVGD